MHSLVYTSTLLTYTCTLAPCLYKLHDRSMPYIYMLFMVTLMVLCILYYAHMRMLCMHHSLETCHYHMFLCLAIMSLSCNMSSLLEGNTWAYNEYIPDCGNIFLVCLTIMIDTPVLCRFKYNY